MICQNNGGAIFSLYYAMKIANFFKQKSVGQPAYREAGRNRDACLSLSLYQ